MSEELKPCPFCGHKKILQNSGDGYFVSCIKCGSRGSQKKYYETMSDAIVAWNTRPIEDEKDKQIERLKEALKKCRALAIPINPRGINKLKVIYEWMEEIERVADEALGKDNNVGSMENSKGGIK